MHDIISAFWFFLPAGIANMTPPIANKIPVLKKWQTPMDFGQKVGGKRLFGPHKTWRGLVCGTLTAGIIASLEYNLLAAHYHTTSTIIISSLLGMILGFGALMGDAVESFFKRRARVPAGRSWFPFDQLDYIIGGLLFIYPFVRPSLSLMAWVVVLYFGLHLAVSYTGYLFGFKDQPV